MPTIAYFYGIAIRMYLREHPPPHFHAIYAEHDATVDIKTAILLRVAAQNGSSAGKGMDACTARRVARQLEEV
jgi:hypothetical protein